MRAPAVCRKQGCPEFTVANGLCESHQPSHGWGTSTRSKPKGWDKVRRRVLFRDRRSCVICGERGTIVDHLLPIAWGGTESMSNLRAMCERDHKAKTLHEQQIGRAGRDPEEIKVFLLTWRR